MVEVLWWRQAVEGGDGPGIDPSPTEASSTSTQDGSSSQPTRSPIDDDNTDGSTRLIRFSSDNFDNDDSRVWETSTSVDPRPFSWTVALTPDGAAPDLKYIYLMRIVGDGGDDDDTEVVRREDFPPSSSPNPNINGRRQTDDKFTFFQELNDTATNLNIRLFSDMDMKFKIDEVYSVMIEWEDDSGLDGRSYSPYFAVMDSNDDSAKRIELQAKVDRFGSEAEDGFDDNSPTGSLPTGAPGTDGEPTGSISVTGAGSQPTATTISDDSDGGGGGGGGGLSTGAIVGIAIGGFIFLCLIAAVAWFLLRRRRKAKVHTGGYTEPTEHAASNAYIVDKVEASGNSPHSPYSDDGQGQHTPLEPNTHHNFSRDMNQAPISPYHDANAAGGSATQQQQQQHGNASRDYSHLVEEGMTAEDIRRLEEEERQLDAEIERAGRR